MRKLVVVLTATAAILLASSVAWKADAQTAAGTGTIVELVLKPCLPGMPRNQCGVSVHVVQGNGVTFPPTNGQAINVQAGQAVGISGNGTVTQSAQATTILNFSASGTITTGSTGTGLGGGGGGGGGGGTTGSIPSGGTNSGSAGPTGTTNAAATGQGGLGSLTSSAGVSSNTSTSVSP